MFIKILCYYLIMVVRVLMELKMYIYPQITVIHSQKYSTLQTEIIEGRPPATETAHIHTVKYDPLYDRIWLCVEIDQIQLLIILMIWVKHGHMLLVVTLFSLQEFKYLKML